ncbi:MAG: hypothetical protein HPKKFMNG_03042 [Planctomycetes bacterium]|nr:hypothetical protein [Planctomycetota bacterium]
MSRWLMLVLAALLAGCATNARHRLEGFAPVAEKPVQAEKPAGLEFPATIEENRWQGERLLLAARYAEALPFFERAAAMTVDPHDEYYNMACCHARLGRNQVAVDFLWKAYETGVNQYPFVANDADLASLKGFAPFEEFMAELLRHYQALERSGGAAIFVEAPALHEVRVRLPDSFDKSRRYPLVIALHEYGGNAGAFAALYDSISYKSDFIFAALNGPCAVPESDENPGGRWWWLHGAPDDGWLRSRAALVQAVLKVRERLCSDYAVDERNIYLLGYRQGGTAAMMICAGQWRQFAGLVAIGSHHLGELGPIEGDFDVLLCHGRKDEKLPFSACEEAQDLWRGAGAEVTVEELIDPGQIGADTTSAVTAWLHAQIQERSGE